MLGAVAIVLFCEFRIYQQIFTHTGLCLR